MNLLDVHAIISIWEEKSYNLNCFKLFFYNNNETSNDSLHTYKSFILAPTDVHIRVRGTRGKLLSQRLVTVHFCLR